MNAAHLPHDENLLGDKSPAGTNFVDHFDVIGALVKNVSNRGRRFLHARIWEIFASDCFVTELYGKSVCGKPKCPVLRLVVNITQAASVEVNNDLRVF